MNTIIFPCPNSVDCPGSDTPISNFSSEAVDAPLFIGLYWGSQGLGICESPVDQETANLCAARNLCIVNTSPRFFNTAQVGLALCNDGTPFNFAVPAGLFCSDTQASADAAALSYANTKAAEGLFCIIHPGVPPTLNAGDPYCGQFSTSDNQPSLWSPVGNLPEGFSLTPGGLLCGTPKGCPTGMFVQATKPNGNFMVSQFILTCNGPPPLPALVAMTVGSLVVNFANGPSGYILATPNNQQTDVVLVGNWTGDNTATLNPNGFYQTIIAKNFSDAHNYYITGDGSLISNPVLILFNTSNGSFNSIAYQPVNAPQLAWFSNVGLGGSPAYAGQNLDLSASATMWRISDNTPHLIGPPILA